MNDLAPVISDHFVEKKSAAGPIRMIGTPDIPSSLLEVWGPVAEPEGLPVAVVRGHGVSIDEDQLTGMGVWECSPGRWRRQIMLAEFAHFIAGHACFYPDAGGAFEIGPGDAIFFPMNTTGTWDISETVRKTYVVFDMRMLSPMIRKIRRMAPRPRRKQAG